MGRVYIRNSTWWIDYLDSNNRRQRISAKTSDKKKAEYLLAMKEANIDGSKDTLNITLNKLSTLWFQHKASKRSIKSDNGRWTNIIAHFGGQTDIQEITSLQLQQWKEKLLLTHKPATVNRYIELLKAVFNLATRLGYKHQDQHKTLDKLILRNARTRIITEQEYRLLLDNADDELRKFMVIGWASGMRLGEIFRLSPSNIRNEEGGISIFLTAEQTKNSSTRIIPIVDNEAKQYLLNWKGWNHNYYYYTKQFAKLARSLHMQNLRFHDVRRSYATRLRRAGVDITVAVKLTGHKTLSVMQKHYSIVEDQDLRSAVEKIACL